MFRKTLLITLFCALIISACGTTPAAPAPQPTQVPATAAPATPVATSAPVTEAPTAITLTDGLGREIKLSAPAQRVISIAPSNTEILFAVGAGGQVIGRDNLSDYPADAQQAQDVGSAFDKLNTELIVSLKPDLILAAEVNPVEQVKALESLGLTVYYLKNPTTLEGMYDNLNIVAQLTGREKESATLIETLKARVKAVDEKIAPLSSRPSVFYEIDATDPAKPYTAGKDTFVGMLIERAGGFNIASDLTGYPQLSLEQVVKADPMFIVLGDSAYGTTPESIAARPGWADLSAVKNKQIFTFDDNLVSRPGPRLVDGLEALAKLLHPDLFK